MQAAGLWLGHVGSRKCPFRPGLWAHCPGRRGLLRARVLPVELPTPRLELAQLQPRGGRRRHLLRWASPVVGLPFRGVMLLPTRLPWQCPCPSLVTLALALNFIAGQRVPKGLCHLLGLGTQLGANWTEEFSRNCPQAVGGDRATRFLLRIKVPEGRAGRLFLRPPQQELMSHLGSSWGETLRQNTLRGLGGG